MAKKTVSAMDIELTLDDRKFRVGIRMSEAQLRRFQRTLGSTDRTLKRHERTIRSAGTSFRHMVVTLGLLREAMRTAWHMTGGLAQGVVETAAEFERLNVLLEGMAKGRNQIERAADAQKQFNQIMDEAKSAPFAVKELTNTWVKFKSVGVDPANGAMRSLVDAVSAFGGTDDILHRASIAVQQMAGKGVISMEELRQQMGEAVPQAMVLLARGMNLSVKDMVDAISKGQVIAKPALEKLFNEFELTFGGRAQRLMETYTGSMARLRTVWQLALKEMGDSSGLLEVATDAVQDLTEKLQDPAIRRFMIDIGVTMQKGFMALVRGVESAIHVFQTYWSEIKNGIKILATLKVAQIGFTTGAMLGARTSALKNTRAFRVYNRVLLVHGSRLRAAGLATVAFSRSVKALLLTNPAGWALAVAGALASMTMMWDRNAEAGESAIDTLLRYGEAAKDATLHQAKLELAIQKSALARNKAASDLAIRGLRSRLGAARPEEDERTREAIRQEEIRINAEIENVREKERRITEIESNMQRERQEAALRDIQRFWRERTATALDAFRSRDVEIDKQFDADKDVDRRLADRLESLKQLRTDQERIFQETVNDQRQIILEAQSKLAQAEANHNVNEAKVQRDKLTATSRFLQNLGVVYTEGWQKIFNQIAILQRDNDFANGADGQLAKQQQAGFERFVKGAAVKLTGLNEQLVDGNTELEKFRTKMSVEFWGNADAWPVELKQMLKDVVPVLQAIDDKTKELKEKRAMDSALRSMEKALARTTEEAKIYADAVDAGFNEVPNNKVRRFRRTIEGLRVAFKEGTPEMAEFMRIASQALAETQSIEASERILDIRGQINGLNVGMVQNARERFELEQAIADEQFRAFTSQVQQAANLEHLVELYNKLRQKQREAFENNTPIRRLATEWEDVMGNMEQAGATFIDRFVNDFVDGIAQGKLAFGDFAKFVLAEIAKIIIRGIIARAVLSFFGAPAGGQNFDVGELTDAGIRLAKGGIMGPNGSMPLKRYARGGIATRPQVAIYGEGDDNEAFVPLPDGRTIPVTMRGSQGPSETNVEVNVINESGVPVEAEQSGQRFDGNRYILDVVLKAANRPGSFRDGMKNSLR